MTTPSHHNLAPAAAVPTFDPLSPEFTRDPYPTLDTLRRESPVFVTANSSVYLLTRYDEILACLRDNTRFSNDHARFLINEERFTDSDEPTKPGALLSMRRDWMLTNDPPRHRKLRDCLRDAFTPRKIMALRPLIERLTSDDLNRGIRRGAIDFKRELAYKLPVDVICALLGVPTHDRDKITRWAESAGFLLEDPGPRLMSRANQVTEEMRDYFAFLIQDRDHHPAAGDLLSRLVVAQREQSILSASEAIAQAVLFFVAGHETTVALLTNGANIILRDPEIFDQLRHDPQLIPMAVEEMLRYESPIKLTARFAKVDLVLGGVEIAQGKTISMSIAAANRDPEQFADPARFDPARTPNRHLAFGHGIHFCIGAGLARLEAEVVFRQLTHPQMPSIRLDDAEPRWVRSGVMRKLAGLSIHFGGPA